MNSDNEVLLTTIESKKQEILLMKKKLKILNNELKENIDKYKYGCNHIYKRECITTGPYPEYANICELCGYL